MKNIKTACNTKSRDTAFILTIDGGAIRGVLPAHVLAYIEKKTGRPIASLFDVIGGTSTGAIGVFALSVPGKNGQPKYSAKDLLSFYNNNDPYVFSVPLWYKLKTLNGLLGPKFLSSRKLEICNKYFPHVKMSQLLTGALVTGYDLDNNKTVIFISWRAQESSNHDFYIAPLLNAITSPPILYSPGIISNLINTRQMTLLDDYVGAQDVLQNKKKLDWLIAKLKQHVPYCQYNKKNSVSHKENTKIEHGH